MADSESRYLLPETEFELNPCIFVVYMYVQHCQVRFTKARTALKTAIQQCQKQNTVQDTKILN